MFDFSEQVIYTHNWMITMPFDPTDFAQQRFFHSAIFACAYISNILRSVCSSLIAGYDSLQIIITSHTRLIPDNPDKTGGIYSVCCFLFFQNQSVSLSLTATPKLEIFLIFLLILRINHFSCLWHPSIAYHHT